MGKNSKVIENLRNIVRKEVAQQLKEDISADKAIPMHVLVNKITKSAGDGIKALENLKNKEMPTQKAMNAIESSVMALEHIFNDMLRNPTAYLDQGDPSEIVRNHVSRIDDQERDLASGQGEPTPI